MIDKQLLSFLGSYRERYNELIFRVCPFCHNQKWNFQCNLDKDVYHCWPCGAKGKVTFLLKRNGITVDRTNWQSSTVVDKTVNKEQVQLDAFVSIDYFAYKTFLHSKGLSHNDVTEYNLLTANSGRYANKLIIPLYEGTKLVYFVARDLFQKGRYYNPVVDKKSILPYYLGTKNRMRLYLCEGAFDSISCNKLGYSSTPLLGSNLSKLQIAKIKDFGFSEVVVCLDGDLKEKAIKIYQMLVLSGIKTSVVWFDVMDEPNELYSVDKEYLDALLDKPKVVSLRDRVSVLL